MPSVIERCALSLTYALTPGSWLIELKGKRRKTADIAAVFGYRISLVMGLFNNRTADTTIAQYFDKHIKGKTIVITGTTNGSISAECAMRLSLSLSLHHPPTPRSPSFNAIFRILPLSKPQRRRFSPPPLKSTYSLKRWRYGLSLLQIRARHQNATRRQSCQRLPPHQSPPSSHDIRLSHHKDHECGLLPVSLPLPRLHLQRRRHYSPWKGYSQSKTANILFSVCLGKKLASKNILSSTRILGAMDLTSRRLCNSTRTRTTVRRRVIWKDA